jgi:hypothetical protein
MRISGPHSGSGRFEEKQNLLHLPGFEPRTVYPVALSQLWLLREKTVEREFYVAQY